MKDEDCEIIPNLFLGNDKSETNYYKYDLIINCNYPYNLTSKYEVAEDLFELNEKEIDLYKSEISENAKRLYKIGIDDREDQDITFLFEKIPDLIYKYLSDNKKIYVHCHMGISRSTSLIISYLLKHKDMGFDDALKLVRLKRPIANPNLYFEQQLREYEKKLNEEILIPEYLFS